MLLQLIGTQLAKYLTKEHIYEDHYFRISIDDIKSALEPGDVVLVEGQSRISNAMQFNSLPILIGLMLQFLSVKLVL